MIDPSIPPEPWLSNDDLWTMATAVLASVACGLVGCWLVLRRLSLLGDAISHAVLPGIAGAFLLTGTRDVLPMLTGATVIGIATAFISSALGRFGRVDRDAALGVTFTSLFALGVVMMSLAARQVDLDPGCVLYGLLEFVPFDTVDLLGVQVPRAGAWLGGALVIDVILMMAFFKELRATSFDPAHAATLGLRVGLVHLGLMAAVAANTVVAFEAVGSILVVAMLVAPGATARLWTDRLVPMLWLASAIAVSTAIVGYLAALELNTSAAGMIATMSMVGYLGSAGIVSARGALRRSASRASAVLTMPQPRSDRL
ncbi:MAG: metal ABC transporter permease [Phycisphaerae bacterium]|nr:metal ABC transporter permease [Phycisphaerae bacterium]